MGFIIPIGILYFYTGFLIWFVCLGEGREPKLVGFVFLWLPAFFSEKIRRLIT